jgi:hypothetical protein
MAVFSGSTVLALGNYATVSLIGPAKTINRNISRVDPANTIHKEICPELFVKGLMEMIQDLHVM